MMGGEYTLVIALAAYLNFITIARNRQFDEVAKICLAGFIISLFASLVLLLVHWDVMIAESGQPNQTLIGVGWFAIAFMIIDAVRFQVAYYKINLQDFAKFTLYLILVSILVKMIGIYFSASEVGIIQFLQTASRSILLVDLNPNHADNVVIFQIAVLSWIVFLLWENNDLRLRSLIVAATVCSYMIYLLIVINSRAAFFGLCVAFIAALMLNAKKLSLLRIVLILTGLISVTFFLPDSVKSRFQLAGAQLYEIVNQYGTTPKHTLSARHHDPELRKEIIETLSNRDLSGSTGQRILNLCYDGEYAGGLSDKYKIDANFSYRLFLQLDGYNLWRKHPYFGHGNYDRISLIRNYSTVDICRIGLFSHLHNHYLDLMVRGGIFALASFLILSGLLLYLVAKDWTASDRSASLRYLPVLMVLIYLFVENLFDISFHRYAPLSAVLFGLSVILSTNLNYGFVNTDNRAAHEF